MKVLEKWKNSILAGWIFAGIAVLLVPLFFVIIINSGYSRRLLKEKIGEMSRITLNNVQYCIDGYLNDLRESAYYVLSDNRFQQLERQSVSSRNFLNSVDECFSILKNRRDYNKGIDYLIYLPGTDYVITDQAADGTKYIYNSLFYSRNQARSEDTDREEMITMGEWRLKIGSDYRNDYFIAEDFSYDNFDKLSLVYAFTNPYSSQTEKENRMNLFVSVSCAFIEALLNKVDNSVLFIVDGSGKQLAQFGEMDGMEVEGWDGKLTGESEEKSFQYGKERYTIHFIKSDQTDWYYVLTVPENIYFNSTRNLRNITIIGILMTICFGLFVTVILHTKNYRQISAIMKLLPDDRKRESGKNEFDVMYSYYSTLNKENLTLKQLFELRKESIRKMFWMDKLKGRNSYLSDDDMMNSLNIPMQKNWVIVALYSEGWDSSHTVGTREDHDLIRFSIHNVVNEVFSGRYTIECLEDSGVSIVLFSLSAEETEEWSAESVRLIGEIYGFFLERFRLQLTIIVSGVCERFEALSSCYSSVQEVLQYQSVLKQSGIVRVEEMAGHKLKETERWEECRRRCILLYAAGNETGIRELADEIFADQKLSAEQFVFSRYQIFALVADALVRKQGALSENEKTAMKKKLCLLTESATWIDMKIICLDILTGLIHAGEADGGDRVQNRLAGEIVDYVTEHYPDKELNISTVADKFRLTPGYLSRLFKQETGVGLLSFINDIRIKKAQELLHSTKKTVYEVAETVGYTNVRSFQRNFTAIVGTAPNEYRRQKAE